MVYNNLAIPTTFIISDINCAILGLDAIMRNGRRLTVDEYKGYLGNDQTEVKIHYIGNYFYLKATVFDGLYNNLDYTRDFESCYYDWYDDFKQENMVYDYIRKIYNKFPSTETTSLEISHNKNQTYHIRSKHQLFLHKKISTNTTSLTYHIAIGANT
eukprot:2368763-Amphidinium_carterae.1